MVSRLLKTTIEERLFKGKAILLLGARQVGKTTLLKELFENQSDVLWLSGDEPDVQNLFEGITSSRLSMLIGKNRYVVIDEAQRIPDIGLKMKLITDQLPDIQLIATGSSSFELSNRVNEPLTGRKWEYTLYPLTFAEMVQHHGLLEEKRLIPHRMVYGYYPEVINSAGNEKEVLRLLSDSYLYKDILMLDQIQKPDKLVRLLQALSWQIGSQVSFNELGNLCGLDAKTVEKYIQLLEKSFIVFRLGSFSRNLRNELKFSRKIYFYDNGIRNALIANFAHIENRNDVGALWENFAMSERIKHLHYSGAWKNTWFWRTREGKEIDLIEESDGMLHAFEFKWNPEAKTTMPKSFLSTYNQAGFTLVHRDNIEDFLV